MRTCYGCGETKPEAAMVKDKSCRNGVSNLCSACGAKRQAEWRAKNKEKCRQYSKTSREKNGAKILEATKKWRRENREHLKKYAQEAKTKDPATIAERLKNWKKRNPGYQSFYARLRASHVKKATPKWLDKEHRFLMLEAKKLAVLRTKLTGFDWHVDHVVPLRGQIVSGLNVPWNLQVIPGVDNMNKSNKVL